ncbi:hypothetical protein VKT23_007967 [Stygiomarasmius scandens]|uniref:Uncharacterized protein n=1 Tax=Marasmiellus scandens TaxID=2682957 RepID=A0ABR1JPC6_9AGAR
MAVESYSVRSKTGSARLLVQYLWHPTYAPAIQMQKANESILYPLSPLDHSGVHQTSITVGYVLKPGPLDISSLHNAAIRLVKRWRLLAGHLEWQPADSTWAIHVPLGEISTSDRDLVKFTTDKLPDVPLNVTLTLSPDSSSACVIPRPAVKFFRHSSIPYSLSSLAKQRWPILAIHITELQDCICVGVSVPHGVFDIFGCGQIIHGLDAELKGKPWSPPEIPEKNIMKEALFDLVNTAPESPESVKTALSDFQRDMVPTSLGNYVRLGAWTAYELFWQKLETKAVFIGKRMLDDLVNKVKAEVRDMGKGWVSTGDVIVAWFIKTAHYGETDRNTVNVHMAFSLRQLLTECDSKIENYPHNSQIGCSYPTLSKENIANLSLAELAIISRQSIDSARNVPFTQSLMRHLDSVGGTLIPERRQGQDSWIISNQVIGRVDDIDFGLEMQSVWFWCLPALPDHTVVVNQFNGGYVLLAGLRQSRWVAIEEEIERIRKEQIVN